MENLKGGHCEKITANGFFVAALLCAVTVGADNFGIGVGVGQP